MSDPRPIGVFDSGVGGLTVLRELQRQLPHERLVYLADLEHFPYGPRPQPEVRSLALEVVRALAEMDTKLVVIACNTATAAALNVARERFDIPVVGVIAPGAQVASAVTRSHRVAVLSTEGTRASNEYVHALKEANPGVAVLGIAAPRLVDIVEAGEADGAEAEAELRPLLERICAWGADCLVLGCTHYPLLIPALQRVIDGRDLRVVDSAKTTAERVRRILEVNRLLATANQTHAGGVPSLQVLVTGDPERFAAAAARLFGSPFAAPRRVRLSPASAHLAGVP